MGGGSDVGGYTFGIPAISVIPGSANGGGSWFYGSGRYDSSTGKFSGDLICDPVREDPLSCGNEGTVWGGSNQDYARVVASSCCGGSNKVVQVVDLTVIDVVQKW